MKKLLTIAMMTAAVSALAVESSNTFGILRVDSTAEQTIVSVPWEGAGATGASANQIMVKDVVKTANLTIGDGLYYYDGSYKYWALTENGWQGAEIASVDANGKTKVTASAGGNEILTRGGAIILVRQNPTETVEERVVAKPFYLYGQYNGNSLITSITRDPSATKLVLLAPPSTSGVQLNDKTWTNVVAGDRIILPSGQALVWHNDTDKWCVLTTNLDTGADQYSPYNTSIPAGQGVWLRLKSGSSAISVAW